MLLVSLLPALSDRRDGMTQADRPAVDGEAPPFIRNIPRVGIVAVAGADFRESKPQTAASGPEFQAFDPEPRPPCDQVAWVSVEHCKRLSIMMSPLFA